MIQKNFLLFKEIVYIFILRPWINQCCRLNQYNQFTLRFFLNNEFFSWNFKTLTDRCRLQLVLNNQLKITPVSMTLKFLHSQHIRSYWFYMKNHFRNFHQIFPFWDPMSEEKRFLQKCLLSESESVIIYWLSVKFDWFK